MLDQFAREMQMRRIDVQRIAAYGRRAVFVPSDTGMGGQAASAMAVGLAAGMGVNESKGE